MGVALATGVEAQLLTTEEIAALWPLMNTQGVLGGLYNPHDGHIAPADLAQSLAAGARQGGAKLHRNCEVTALAQAPDGAWRVETSQGVIFARHVVSCGGNHSQRIAEMVGLTAQCVPVRHQYFVTEPLDELTARRKAGLPELPVMRDPEDVFYCRQEGDALLVGAYDGRGEARFIHDAPEGSAEPFPDELEKLLPHLERAMLRIPAIGAAGVRRVVNYAMPYTPDDLPTAGPAFGLRNFWLAEGNPFGITLAGGIGWQLAEWITEGVPSIDMWCCDSRRFGNWGTREWSAGKVEEAYEHTYLLPKPGEELPAARGLRTTPIHDLLAARGARFGAVAGWERPNWFAPRGVEDKPSFGKPNWFYTVGAECRAAETATVIADVSHGAVIRISGAGAAEFLGRVFCVDLPSPGHSAPATQLTARGAYAAEAGVICETSERYIVTAAAVAERYLLDLLLRKLPDSGVRIDNLTGRKGALMLFGRTAYESLQAVTQAVFSEVGFSMGAVRAITLGYAPVRVERCDPFGFPGFRLHVASEMLRHVFLALGDIRLIGARALESLRLEIGNASWPSELNSEVTPDDVAQAPGAAQHLLHVEIDGADTMPHGLEPVRDARGQIVGRTTSAGWGHLRGKALAFALVEPGAEGLQICVMGRWHKARATKRYSGAEAQPIQERETV